jgi:uncharacterized protein with HEPN domain
MRRDDQRLNDILEALDWISRAVIGKTEADFVADDTLCYAVARRLITVGEAVARLSFEIRARDASVPWQDIVGLRDILVHEYFGIHWPWCGKRRWITCRPCAHRSRPSARSSDLDVARLRPSRIRGLRVTRPSGRGTPITASFVRVPDHPLTAGASLPALATEVRQSVW